MEMESNTRRFSVTQTVVAKAEANGKACSVKDGSEKFVHLSASISYSECVSFGASRESRQAFELTPEETAWTHDLKSLLSSAKYNKKSKESPSVLEATKLSDFDIAQFAICAKGNSVKALKRVRKLHVLKQAFMPEGEAGVDLDKSLAFMEFCAPGMLKVSETDSTGRQVMCMATWSSFDPSKVSSEKEWSMFFQVILALRGVHS